MNTRDMASKSSCIRLNPALFLCIIRCGTMETIDLTMELLQRSIEIRWSMAEHALTLASWRGATCVNRLE